MPKEYTFPVLYDEVLQINIADLKKWGYLTPNRIQAGSINWKRHGKVSSSVGLKSNTVVDDPYVELSYSYSGQNRAYYVKFVHLPSNLGKGKIWYFLCPSTQKRCRKLYFIGGYFLHREAFSEGMYTCQTWSKNVREAIKEYWIFANIDERIRLMKR